MFSDVLYNNGYLYHLEEEKMTYGDADHKCKGLDGFQLGIYKTEETFYFLQGVFNYNLRDGNFHHSLLL